MPIWNGISSFGNARPTSKLITIPGLDVLTETNRNCLHLSNSSPRCCFTMGEVENGPFQVLR